MGVEERPSFRVRKVTSRPAVTVDGQHVEIRTDLRWSVDLENDTQVYEGTWLGDALDLCTHGTWEAAVSDFAEGVSRLRDLLADAERALDFLRRHEEYPPKD